MAAAFPPVFAALKSALDSSAKDLKVKSDTTTEYALVSRTPSPLPQHKGHPLDFASVRVGKAYVSFHLLPLYMSPKLNGLISPELKKRLQGKSCFNFKTVPPPETVAELRRLTEAALAEWARPAMALTGVGTSG
jgi:hypothetical protein